MQIVKIRTVNGPNIFHSCPVIVMQLNLESYTEISSADLPNFKERLLQFLPGLQEHHCSPGRPGGFLERLDRGTYFAHIVEHVALEMSELAGIPVFYGKSVYAGKEGHYNVVVRFKNEDGMKILLQEAVSLVTALYEGQNKFDLQYGIERAKRAASRSALGPSTKAIVDAAKARGIPWRRIGKESLIQFGYGKNIRRIQAGVTDKTPLIAADMVQDKDFTKTILEEANAPFPEARVVRDIQELEDALQEIDGPWALKPLDGNHGNGVVLNLTNLEEAIKAYEIAKEFCDYILVERMCTGRDYRILVIGGRLVAAAERKPAHVVGDGVLSVAALIDKTNLDPRRGEGHAAVLTKIEIDELLIECLRKNHFTLESIPQAGETVWLRETANLSTGGTAADVTDSVHPQIRALCERIARFTGLDICGIDFIHSDISKPLERGSGVIEVNAGPGLRMHIAPTEGKGRDVGGEIIDMLYPPGTNSRIPIVAITGTNGKTTTTRLTGHLFASQTRKVVGMTTSEGVSIGKECVSQGDTTGPVSARLVLSDPSVEIAVLETARGGLMRGGLAYDWSDVGIITNLKPDHIGQDGIEDIEDIIRVKSLVAERVREGGTLVLNADDYETSRLMTRPNLTRTPKNLVYYSLDRDNELLQRHVADGGVAFTIEEGQICEVNSQGHFPIVHVEDLPFTMNGTAEFQVSNALASSAAGRALGLSRSQVAQGLSTFNNTSQNSGRANLYQVGKGYLMLDYGHNTDAISAIGRMSEQWAGFTTTAVIGLPGDRSDDILRAASREAAKHFDRIIARDDYNRRGRAPLEIPNLIRQVVAEVNPSADFRIIAEEDQALDFALGNIREREVVILFYDELETTLETIKRFDPIPIAELPLKLVASEFGAEIPSRRQAPQAAIESNGASWAH